MTDAGSTSCLPGDVLERAVVQPEAWPDAARHIASCPSCREQAAHIRENISFMRGLMERVGTGAIGIAGPGGDEVPGYCVIRAIARGGQAAVYEAVQLATKRPVALKIVQADDDSPRARARFDREVELAASLRHPGIVTVHGRVPLADGRSALVMELVDGVPLDAWARAMDRSVIAGSMDARAAVRAKVAAVRSVCDAVAHAHLNGVIHRDLKPGNVLIAADGSVHVVDFGVARRAGHETRLTREGGFAGTLAYASPEQVSGGAVHVDARADIHALGLMLYEVLSGRHARDAERPVPELLHEIARVPIPALTSTAPDDDAADPDLGAIVAKAAALVPDDRYQSAAAMEADLGNWLDGRVIDARRTSTAYVLRKMAARHRVGVAFAAAGLAFVLALAGFMAWTSRTLERQRALLAAALSASNVERGRSVGRAGENARAESLIWPALLESGADLDSASMLFEGTPQALHAAWALAELYSRHPSLLHAPIPAGSHVFHVESDGTASLLAPDGSRLRVAPDTPGVVVGDAGSVHGARAGIHLSTDRRHAVLGGSAWVQLADDDPVAAQDGLAPRLLPGEKAWDVSADANSFLVVRPDGRLELRHPGQAGSTWSLGDGVFGVNKPSFSEEGDLVLWGVADQILTWQAQDGRAGDSWPVPAALASITPPQHVRSVRMSADGRILAAAIHNQVLLYDARNPGSQPRHAQPAHRGIVAHVELSSSGSTAVSSASEQVIKVWDCATGQAQMAFETGAPLRGRPVPDSRGRAVAFCDELDRLRVFGTRTGAWLERLHGANHTVQRAQFSPDGAVVAAVSTDGAVHGWRTDSGDSAWRVECGAPLTALAFSPDGTRLAVAEHSGSILALSVTDLGAPPVRLGVAPSFATWIGFSPDGRWIVVLTGESWCTVLDSRTGLEVARLSGHDGRVVDAAFASDGGLFTVGADGVLIAWTPDLRHVRFRTPSAGGMMRAVALSPDEDVVATGSDDRVIRLWDARNGALVRSFGGSRQHVFGLAFHRLGNVLVSCGRDEALQVWDARTGTELAVLDGHEGMVLSVAFSPDGRSLATASADRTVGLWTLDTFLPGIRASAAAHRQPPAE